MLQNISLVANQVLILFILIAIGVICNKTKLLSGSTIKQMTDFVLYIVVPAVIINSFNREYNPKMLKGLLVAFGLSFLSFAINIILSRLLIKDKDKRRERVLQYGAIYSNAGFMSLPLQQAILGDKGVFYGAVFIAVYNIINWTYGVVLMSGSLKAVSLKKMLINPGIIGTVIGLIFFIIPFSLPQVITAPLEYISSLNTPIPMVIIGFHLANSSFKIKGFSAYFSMLFRLVLSPLLFLAIFRLMGIEKVILVSMIIALSAPFAATNTMFSQKFDADTPLSASLVSVTTLISIITMPVIIGLAL